LASQSEHLPGLEVEAHAVDNGQARDVDMQVRDLEQRRHAARARSVTDWGSNMSRKLSPRKLNARTTDTMARPGNTPIHQLSKCCAPVETIEPHSAAGGFAPRPRKDRPDSSRMAVPISSAARTMTGPATLGNTST